MSVKLIPVIEITYYSFGDNSLMDGPYWKYAEAWDTFKEDCLKKAGFPDKMNSYDRGGSLYSLSDITDANLLKLIKDEWEDSDKDVENLSTLVGGYVLNINEVDKLYPQCCGDLGDISEWERLLTNEENPYFWIGHPSPSIVNKGDTVVFDLEHPNVSEGFVPEHNDLYIEVSKEDLAKAIDGTKKELDTFADRLSVINEKGQLNIPDIAQILIYGNN